MMEFPIRMWDNETYPLMPQEHRWIYNKLTVAEKFGYKCGPSGTPMTDLGYYCIRPIMNSYGYGFPGFLKFDYRGKQPEYYPGYFWCEWFEGDHEWINFTDGEVVTAWRYGQPDENGFKKPTMGNPSITKLPDILTGISKHMLVELIDGKIIEVSPRHSENRGELGKTEIREEATEPYVKWPGRMWVAYLDGKVIE